MEEHSNTNRTPYLFNGKELDACPSVVQRRREETGLYYYGARYYDPQISIFASFDPLAELYPNVSPYAYVFNNPLNYIDPTGMSGEGVTDPPTEEELEATKEGGWVKSNDGHTQKLAAVTVKASRIEDNNSGGGNGIGKAGNDVQDEGNTNFYRDNPIASFSLAGANYANNMTSTTFSIADLHKSKGLQNFSPEQVTTITKISKDCIWRCSFNSSKCSV